MLLSCVGAVKVETVLSRGPQCGHYDGSCHVTKVAPNLGLSPVWFRLRVETRVVFFGWTIKS